MKLLDYIFVLNGDVPEEFKYPAMLVYTPNYMNLKESNLKISVDK